MREQTRAVRGREAAAGPVPVDVGVDVALLRAVVGADEEVEPSVVVEVGHGHGVDGVAGSSARLSSRRPSGPFQ